jgi:hypothetical protein
LEKQHARAEEIFRLPTITKVETKIEKKEEIKPKVKKQKKSRKRNDDAFPEVIFEEPPDEINEEKIMVKNVQKKKDDEFWDYYDKQ